MRVQCHEQGKAVYNAWRLYADYYTYVIVTSIYVTQVREMLNSYTLLANPESRL